MSDASPRYPQPPTSTKSGVAESVGMGMTPIGVVLSVVSLGGCWGQLGNGGDTGTWGFLFWSGAVLGGVGATLMRLSPPPF